MLGYGREAAGYSNIGSDGQEVSDPRSTSHGKDDESTNPGEAARRAPLT